MPAKNPKIKLCPQCPANSKKAPSLGNQFISHDSGQISWSFSLIDRSGLWGFNKITQEEFCELITDSFKNKEGINWATIKKSGSHNVRKDKLIPQAQKRLGEIKLDDLDELFSMRFTGEKRIWGIRDGNVFKLLWWDPNHEICPSAKKGT